MHASASQNTYRHVCTPTHTDIISLHENNIKICVIYSPLYGLLGYIEKEKAIGQATHPRAYFMMMLTTFALALLTEGLED